jgi:integration host factor subunit beta
VLACTRPDAEFVLAARLLYGDAIADPNPRRSRDCPERRAPGFSLERTMTKADLVEEISRITGLNKKDTSIIVNEVINNICRALADGDKVELRGFGSFKVKERRARQARNPRTGDGVQVPAKLVPFFKASNELKARVNDSHA